MPIILITCSLPITHPLLEDQDALDALLLDLVDRGAGGTTQSSSNQFEIYMESDDLDSALQEAKTLLDDSMISVSGQVVAQQNWTQTSAELLAPIKAGQIQILPVTGLDEAKKHPKTTDQILIIPGMGFGTGHHATTKTIIEVLQQSTVVTELKKFKTLDTADFGTGSGLLAIAIALLFPALSTPVFAFDNDPAAIENARENASINGVDSSIRFEVTDHLEGTFHLVTANIYAEVLCECYTQFLKAVLPGGILILSGIMKHKLEMIQNTFTSENWQWLESKVADDWATVTLKREKES